MAAKTHQHYTGIIDKEVQSYEKSIVWNRGSVGYHSGILRRSDQGEAAIQPVYEIKGRERARNIALYEANGLLLIPPIQWRPLRRSQFPQFSF